MPLMANAEYKNCLILNAGFDTADHAIMSLAECLAGIFFSPAELAAITDLPYTTSTFTMSRSINQRQIYKIVHMVAKRWQEVFTRWHDIL